MIKDVVIKKVDVHADERGFFAELVKFGEETFHEILQTSYSETKPGVIKGFHIHDYWEVWCIIKGQAKVVLHDMRESSPTKGETQVILTGEDNMMVIAIPGEVAHGYQPLGSTPMGIIYHASAVYNPKNVTIRTIPFDSPTIGFDWSADSVIPAEAGIQENSGSSDQVRELALMKIRDDKIVQMHEIQS